MPNEPRYNTLLHFDKLFAVLSSSRFLNKEGLGGELPFFIHSYPVAKESEVAPQITSLIKRLSNAQIEVLGINLYTLCIDILQRENVLEQIIQQESKMPKQRLVKTLNSVLNIDKVVIPEIHARAEFRHHDMVFLYGVGAAYPMVRSHTILNNIQTLTGDIPMVMFFPGTYNNESLTLFDRLKDDNYYRAHLLNEYTI